VEFKALLNPFDPFADTINTPEHGGLLLFHHAKPSHDFADIFCRAIYLITNMAKMLNKGGVSKKA